MTTTELKPVHGKHKFLLFRLLEDATKKAAAKLALQTEHEWSYERDIEMTKTKDGSMPTSGALEVTLDITAIASYDEVNEMLFKAVTEDKTLEVWEIDTNKPTAGGKFSAVYARGKLSSWTLPNNLDSFVEVSTSFSVEGVPVTGEATLTAEQKLLIASAYDFMDTTQVTAG